MHTTGYAAYSPTAPLALFQFERRSLRANDVAMEILYSDVCHPDLHTAPNDWGWSYYPIVPGHEIVGRVAALGAGVSRYRVGDHVAVGCMVDSCPACDQCRKGEEQLCRAGNTSTYAGQDRITGENTQGGCSKHLVVREEFCLRIPEGLDLALAAPLLCAGITTWSSLGTWNVGPGGRVGVIGLGHMAVGLGVTVLSRSNDKQVDALALGAARLLVSSDPQAMEKATSDFDLIIDMVSVKHDLTPYLPLLDVDGTLAIVGQVGPTIQERNTAPLLLGRRRIADSLIGGIHETQEMLGFCAEKNILPDCEMIRIDQINEAFERMERADVRYRFVIDKASLPAQVA
ncbi:uncharacterized zinc-type alcohol dehydrogenase-like protein [Variovorax sp. YR266]|nr:uncharacterized zinc-type alcohol dehydrogenase-like protein [Variovorax sp. YR266]